MAEPYLYTEALAVGYGGRTLIGDIALQVHRGEILTLIGPNGAGKSTILKSLARQLALSGGRVFLAGQDMQQLSGQALARQLALVTTERVDPELLTCAEIVSAGRYPYTGRLGILSPADRAVVADAMDRVHARDLADRPFSCLSDGQRQRVLLARALAQQPTVILLDEPTSYLDIRHKLELLDILKQLVRQEGLAVVLSLHELDLAQKISDTVACVRPGRIGPVGPPETIFTEPVIRELYGLPAGSYSPALGSAELPGVPGAPQVFVIGGGGSGLPVYRRLERAGVPFAAGILQKTDQEYPVAKALAAALVAEEAWQPIAPETEARARALLDQCPRAVCCVPALGPLNEANRRLWEAAGAAGKQADWHKL